MRRPSPARQSETACSLPSRTGRRRAERSPPGVCASSFQTATAFAIVLVRGLGHEREAPARVERRVGDRLGAKRHPGDRHDAKARVLPRHPLTRCRVTQVVAGAAPVALEPEPEPFGAQKNVRTAAATRATEGT